MSWLRRVAPWLLLGPISGILAEGLYRNLRRGERVLAGLYILAIIVTMFDLLHFGKQVVEAL